jgi:hypothetical protein
MIRIEIKIVIGVDEVANTADAKPDPYPGHPVL